MDQMTNRPYATTAELHHSYPVTDGPRFEGIDLVGLVFATIMALGPLTAYTVGF